MRRNGEMKKINMAGVNESGSMAWRGSSNESVNLCREIHCCAS